MKIIWKVRNHRYYLQLEQITPIAYFVLSYNIPDQIVWAFYGHTTEAKKAARLQARRLKVKVVS